MSNLRRIFVVENNEFFNRNVVNALQKEGYIVQSALNGTDAVRLLWSEPYDVVLSSVQVPGANGFELLQWLRAYRPNTYIILMGEPEWRARALESGATSYLEKPFDLRAFQEELRRLLQQTGFSADLESFDLLDVIQMITMSHRSMALLVNTGLEERGMLRFQDGDLIWAEYGMLRGEEAFFALAAHKSGSVVQQPWNGGGGKNVMQPLSRLIFQALQYRTKYANGQGNAGVAAAENSSSPLTTDEYDDTPFGFIAEDEGPMPPVQTSPIQQDPIPLQRQQPSSPLAAGPTGPSLPSEDVRNAKEWWQLTGKMASMNGQQQQPATSSDFEETMMLRQSDLTDAESSKPSSQPPALPSWLTGEPAAPSQPSTVRPAGDFSAEASQLFSSPSSPEWPPSGSQSTGQIPPFDDIATSPIPPSFPEPEWPMSVAEPQSLSEEPAPLVQSADVSWMFDGNESEEEASTSLQEEESEKYNYPALVSALQTLGYSIHGFIAAAVVGLNGHPIAQVTVDDIDISRLCQSMSGLLRHATQTIGQEQWGDCEQFSVTSAQRRVFVHMLGEKRNAFQMLVTAYDVDLVQCMEIMTNVEGAIEAALA
jgi:DNA-binding response OmpR family regulator/predicted regulator of Ras-like GTPase activity (Roadblock/LC7/MglB family)